VPQTYFVPSSQAGGSGDCRRIQNEWQSTKILENLYAISDISALFSEPAGRRRTARIGVHGHMVRRTVRNAVPAQRKKDETSGAEDGTGGVLDRVDSGVGPEGSREAA
jgi:hypothetical protein